MPKHGRHFNEDIRTSTYGTEAPTTPRPVSVPQGTGPARAARGVVRPVPPMPAGPTPAGTSPYGAHAGAGRVVSPEASANVKPKHPARKRGLFGRSRRDEVARQHAAGDTRGFGGAASYVDATGAFDGAGFVGQDQRSRAAGAAAYAQRRRKRGKRGFLSNLLIIAGMALLLVAGGMFGYAQLQYRAQDKVNEQLAAYATVSDDPASRVGPQVDLAGLKSVNPDVVGWVQIPGTVVNYPVYQGSDNDEYLHKDANGDSSIGGQIFLDYENTAPGLAEQQTVIYGHHLYNGTMFTPVDAMADQAEFDKVSTVWYVTERATYELEPLFFYRTPATNGEARHISFASDDEFHTYLKGLLDQASAKSVDAGEAVTKVSKVVTLATCDYDNNFGQGNGRGLVVCALKSEVSGTGTSGN